MASVRGGRHTPQGRWHSDCNKGRGSAQPGRNAFLLRLRLQILGSGGSPLLARRGGSGIKKNDALATLAAGDGVVDQDQKDLLKLNHHPVRSIKGASRYFS